MILTEKKPKDLEIDNFDDYQGDFHEGMEYE